MRVTLITISAVALIATILLSLVVAQVTSATDGHSAIPLWLIGSTCGFALALYAAAVAYHQRWYRWTSLVGAAILTVTAVPWFQHRGQMITGILILVFVLLWLIDAFTKHECTR